MCLILTSWRPNKTQTCVARVAEGAMEGIWLLVFFSMTKWQVHSARHRMPVSEWHVDVPAKERDGVHVALLFCREVSSHGPEPEWNDSEPTLSQRLAEKSAHLVQPACQEDPQVRTTVSRREECSHFDGNICHLIVCIGKATTTSLTFQYWGLFWVQLQRLFFQKTNDQTMQWCFPIWYVR